MASINDDDDAIPQVVKVSVPVAATTWIRTPVVLPGGLLAIIGTFEIGVLDVTIAQDLNEFVWQAEDNGGMDLTPPQITEKLIVYPTPFSLVFRDFRTGDIKGSAPLGSNYLSNDFLHMSTDQSRAYLTVSASFSSVVYAYANPDFGTDAPTTVPTTGAPTSSANGQQGGEYRMTIVLAGIFSWVTLWRLLQ